MLVYPLVARLSGFSWTPENRRTALVFALLTSVVFAATSLSPSALSYTVGIALTLAAAAYSCGALISLVPAASLMRVCDKLPGWLGRSLRTRVIEAV
jgi:antigen flippase